MTTVSAAAATCKSCGAEIIWAVTANGKRMPLDAKHSSGFTIEGIADAREGTPLIASSRVYISHFATCPNAAEHRRNAA